MCGYKEGTEVATEYRSKENMKLFPKTEITQDNKELALTTPSELTHECFILMFNLFQLLSPK